jgi:hypothetical protein
LKLSSSGGIPSDTPLQPKNLIILSRQSIESDLLTVWLNEL